MKENETRWLGTLRQRMLLVMGVCVLGCFILIVVVSYMMLQSSERNRVETTMRADLVQVSEMMDEQYDTLLQLSQQTRRFGVSRHRAARFFENGRTVKERELGKKKGPFEKRREAVSKCFGAYGRLKRLEK